MLTLPPFGWRPLTPNAAVEHCLDDTGALLLRAHQEERRSADTPPILRARVRDGEGGFHVVPFESLGFDWYQTASRDAWMLRTSGAPVTMAQVADHWTSLVRTASAALRVDERVLLATIASEVGSLGPDADGHVKAARTENGYPRRTGETDSGDFARDLEDWTTSGGMHSSHGLLQTLIGTAVRLRPDLFHGVDPSRYRTVLWDPANALACGAAYVAQFPESVRADPLATRFQYAAGDLTPSAKSRWGVALYDELVPLWFVAFWNDDAALRAGESVAVLTRAPGTAPSKGKDRAVWLSLAGLSGVAGLYAWYCHAEEKKRIAAAEQDDDETDEEADDEEPRVLLASNPSGNDEADDEEAPCSVEGCAECARPRPRRLFVRRTQGALS
jgi:hypothetical protein